MTYNNNITTKQQGVDYVMPRGKLTLVEKAQKEMEKMEKENVLTDGALALKTDGETGGGETDTPKVAVNLVSISFKKTQQKRMINVMASINNATVEENEDAYVISAPYIKVTRADVEGAIGKISDAKWRMLFVNRSGEVKEFNNYEFTIGTPKPAVQEEDDDGKETTQLNIRIDKLVKDELETYRSRDFLGLSQAAFVEAALKEFIANIKKEII